MRYLKENSNLNIKEFLKLSQLFKEKQWNDYGEYSNEIFNRFCDRLALFDNEQQALILDLTNRFIIIDDTLYLSTLINLFKENEPFNREIANEYKTWFFSPLLAPCNRQEEKSSKHLYYLTKSGKLKCDPYFINKNITHIDSSKLNQLRLEENQILILFDDYIGSGETAYSAVSDLVEHGVSKDKIIILALACQEKGIKYLHANNIKCYTNIVMRRGISDYYTHDQLDNALAKMQAIEKVLRVIPKFTFGYNHTEALVKLIRTPNNTFPVYWLENDREKKAPFPR
ncbi:MAG: uracil phosphoribosyltransferase [Anaerofustis sp.]